MVSTYNNFDAGRDHCTREHPSRGEFEELRHAVVGQARQWLGQHGTKLDEILALQMPVRTRPRAAELGRQEAGRGRTVATVERGFAQDSALSGDVKRRRLCGLSRLPGDRPPSLVASAVVSAWFFALYSAHASCGSKFSRGVRKMCCSETVDSSRL